MLHSATLIIAACTPNSAHLLRRTNVTVAERYTVPFSSRCYNDPTPSNRDSTYYGGGRFESVEILQTENRTDPQLQLDESTGQNPPLGGAATTSFTVKLASLRENM